MAGGLKMAFTDSIAQGSNPVDLIEELAATHDWSTERTADDELTLVVKGQWTDYSVSFNWRDELEALHVACAFDMKAPEARHGELYKLLAQINEKLWIGHFDLWPQDGLIMFRHGLLLNGTAATEAQCAALLRSALDACERYYQAFQFVVWAGKDSREALSASAFQTEGHA
jgi:hypothetical protein